MPIMFTIRRYADSDFDAVWRLHHQALEDTGADAGRGPWDDDLAKIRAVYIDPAGEFLVGTLDGEIVAMDALLVHSQGDAQIKRMRVDPHYQRRGFGTQILQALEVHAAGAGFSKLRLDTTSVQSAAQRFYEAKGYGEISRRSWRDGQMIYYEKAL